MVENCQAEERVVRVAAITGELDWRRRQDASGDNYDFETARNYIQQYLAAGMARLEDAAAKGAAIVVAPEYFAATELFTTTEAKRRELVQATTPAVLDRLISITREHRLHVACAMDYCHGEKVVQTGVVISPDQDQPELQVKNTALPPGHPLAQGYRLFMLGPIKAGLFVCSDLTSFPEDPINLAKAGMELLLTPGCGFAGDNWLHFLKVRSIDLGVPVIYADDGRGAILDYRGEICAETQTAGAVILADLEIPLREPVEKLYSYVGRRK